MIFVLSATKAFCWMGKEAPALPVPAGNVVRVSSVNELQDAVQNIQSNTTILVEAGEYKLTRTLVFDGVDSVALRGATGNRDDVIIRGGGMLDSTYINTVPHVIVVWNVNDILIADLTAADAWYHNFHLAGSRGPIRPHLYNVHSLDCGEQHLKVNPGYNPTAFPDTGIVEYCRFEFTDRAKHWYTNGVDVLDGANWVARDNEFVRIRGPVGVLAGPAILFWHTCYNTIVERNFLYECDVGITLGLNAGNSKRFPESEWDHVGGIIRNNVIFRKGTGDVGISVNHHKDFKIYNNTVFQSYTFPWDIEYRFSSSSGEIRNNLTGGPIFQRDGATATVKNNHQGIQTAWFEDFNNADLHLTVAAELLIDAAVVLDEVPDDYDGHARPVGEAPDIGADEFGSVAEEKILKGDGDDNGVINIFDLLAMLKALSIQQYSESMDLDDNGSVNIFDLLALLRLLSQG